MLALHFHGTSVLYGNVRNYGNISERSDYFVKHCDFKKNGY